MDLNTLITLLTAMGGLELLKWLYTKRSNARIIAAQADKAENEADKDEFHLLREHVEFLQDQLRKKEERFSEQTDVVRQLNTEIISLTKEKSILELELQKKRCEVKCCPNRQPQNGY